MNQHETSKITLLQVSLESGAGTIS